MEWLSQNWIWLVLIVGAMMMLSRGRQGGMGGCCGMAHEGPAGESKTADADSPRPPLKEEKPGHAAEGSPSSHKHGRGGCC